MTDRAILERARELCVLRKYSATAYDLGRLINTLPIDPPTDTVPVRIAVAIAANGDHFVLDIDESQSNAQALAILTNTMCVCDVDEIAASAVLTASIPRRTVPVVEATVEVAS